MIACEAADKLPTVQGGGARPCVARMVARRLEPHERGGAVTVSFQWRVALGDRRDRGA